MAVFLPVFHGMKQNQLGKYELVVISVLTILQYKLTYNRDLWGLFSRIINKLSLNQGSAV